MQISQTLVDEGLNLLRQDEDEILTRLGVELYSWDRQQPTQALLGSISAKDLRQRATEYLANKRQVLKKAVCHDWEEHKREDFLDTSKLLTAVILAVAQALNLTPPYINLAMVTAVIITKRGIDNFCKE